MLLTVAAAAALCQAGGAGQRLPRFNLPDDFGAAGTGSVELQLGYYDRADSPGQGNPFLNEEVTVIEPIVVFDYNASDTFGYSGLLVYDNVSSASIDRLSRFPEQSGATGDFYIGADFGLRWKTSEQSAVGARLGYSAEYDYQSIHLGGDYSYERADKNARVTFSLDAFLDTIEPIRWNGVTDPDEDRTSIAATASWFQVIDERTNGTFGVTLASQTGFLETAYNSVIVDNGTGVPNPDLHNDAAGFELPEEVPDSRFRTILFGRARRLLSPGNALELGGRIYSDDWGITAFDLGPKWIRSFGDGRHLLELRYRFYTQGAADFYQREIFADPPPEERSQDADLGDFSSHNFGLTWNWNTSDSTRWSFGLDYSMRDDDLDNLYGLIGYRWNF